MNRLMPSTAIVLLAACLLLAAGDCLAAFEWNKEASIPLTANARDFAESPDGERLFVLTGEGTILVLDRDGRVEATIPGPFTADRLSVSHDGSKLYLGGKGQDQLQVISLSERFIIDIAGSPFKGDAAAAVAVVVFSDFQ